MNSERIIYLNGEFVPESRAVVSVFDQGLVYGDGVFEGIRVYNGRVFKCEEHVDRLFRSAKAVALDIRMERAAMIEVVTGTCRRNGLRDGYVKLQVTRGLGDLSLLKLPAPRPTVFCIATSLAIYPEELYENGMKIITSSYRRNKADRIDPQIKSLNYLNNILAKIEASAAGAPEALMLNEEGLVAECTGDNVFLVVDGRLWTPPVHVGVLDGVTRRTVMELARGMGIEVL
jgi:branched chain amino acid aminotransferase (EC 2.6.1.42)